MVRLAVISALALALCAPASAFRLTLVPGQPVISADVTGAVALYDSDLGTPGASLSLSGRAALSLHDVFKDSSGQLFTVPMPDMSIVYVPMTGTPIGGMTGNGGLSAAFDGNLSKGWATSDKSPGAVSGYSWASTVGIQPTSPLPLTKFIATAPNNGGFVGDASGSTTSWQLTASATCTFTGSIVLDTGFVPIGTASASFTRTINNQTAYSCYYLTFYGNGPNAIYIAQFQPFYTQTPPPRGIVSLGNVEVNDQAISNGVGNSGPVTCAANACTYRGTIQIDDTPGQVSCILSLGFDSHCGIWNVRDQREICLQAGDNRPATQGPLCHAGVPCYIYTPTVYGASQPPYQLGPMEGNPLVRLRVLSGLLGDFTQARLSNTVFENGQSAYWFRINSNGAAQCANLVSHNYDTSTEQAGTTLISECLIPPFSGVVTLTAHEGQRYNASAFWHDIFLRACFKY
jgi:hypothetical protein